MVTVYRFEIFSIIKKIRQECTVKSHYTYEMKHYPFKQKKEESTVWSVFMNTRLETCLLHAVADYAGQLFC